MPAGELRNGARVAQPNGWLPDIEAVGEPDRLLSPFINGIKHLDCRFTPITAPAR